MKSIAHSDLIGNLIEAVQLPAKVAVVSVKGHATGDSDKVRGNPLADAAAKEAAKKQCTKKTVNAEIAMKTHIANLPDSDFRILQSPPSEADL